MKRKILDEQMWGEDTRSLAMNIWKFKIRLLSLACLLNTQLKTLSGSINESRV